MPNIEELEREIRSLKAQVASIRRAPTYLNREYVSEEPPVSGSVFSWSGAALKFRNIPVLSKSLLKMPSGSARYCKPGWFGYAAISQAVVAGTVYYLPIAVDRPVTFDRLSIRVSIAGAASTLARLALFAWNDGLPGSLLLDGGTVATDSGGSKDITISQTLHGLYFLATVCDGTPSLGGIDPSGGACSPAVTAVGTTNNNSPYNCVLTVTGLASIVANGYPSTADAPTGQTTPEFGSGWLRYTS